jgi:hypothetical protein
MMDPGMMGAPMPPMDAMGGGMPPMDAMGGMAPAGPMNPVEAVVMALKGMELQRKDENDALMLAVLQATGAMPNGLEGVSEGAPMAVPPGGGMPPMDAGPMPADAGMGY